MADAIELRPGHLGVTPLQRKVFELRHESDPPRSWSEIARLLGRDISNVRASYKRAVEKMARDDEQAPAKRRRASSEVSGRRGNNERLSQLWGTRAEQSLAGMTIDKFEKAKLRDLAVAAGIATDKLLLLRGQPTEIVKTETDRRNLMDLVGAFLIEAKRRNVEIDVSPLQRRQDP